MTGIICVNKEKDITSFGVCAKMRGILKEKKVGHTGTLDPMATGVLPVMIGGATRFLDYLPESDKGYRASFLLGKTTDTLDITGSVTSEKAVNAGRAEVENVLSEFKGIIKQLPPMYSAVSVNGKRLYDLARQGIEIERQEREVEIKKLSLVDFREEANEYTIDVFCTKGTYVRTLIDDIGKKLGCGAVMTALIRTSAMGFKLEDCKTLTQLQELKDGGIGFDDVLLPLDKALAAYNRVVISHAQTVRFKNGGALDKQRIKQQLNNDMLYRVYSPENEFLGLGKTDNKQLKVQRLLVNR